jgi:N-acetylglucosamine transport system substrate-binding protein
VPANANNDNFLKNQQLILDNKAIFMPNGTWVIGEMKDAPRADGFAWGFTALPAVAEGGDRYSYTWFEQIWVPEEAANKDAAKQFVAFMYSDAAADIFAKTGAIQPIVGFADKLEGDNKLFFSIYDQGAKAALGAFAATDPVEGVNFADTVFGTVNSLVSGDKTVEQWVEQIKADSDLLRGALK